MSSRSSISRNTKQREVVLSIIEKANKPLSAPQITAKAQKLIPSLNKTTVYRTLERLEGEGLISKMLVQPNMLHYEMSHGGGEHHHHFICNTCERVFCLEGCTQSLQQMIPKGFTLIDHEITLRGICKECKI